MIKLGSYEFQFACASGALGFDGRGWWWEKPLRWAGLIDPSQFLVITKSLTWFPRVGNLKMWCPWRCVRLLPNDGTINAVGLTNMGFTSWLLNTAPALDTRWRYVISIAPEDAAEAATMVDLLCVHASKPRETEDHGVCVIHCRPIVGIELNLSCPNSNHKSATDQALHMAWMALTAARGRLPIGIKVGATQPGLWDIVDELDGEVAFWDMINTVPWGAHTPGAAGPSPLAKYGLVGGLSGGPIRQWAEQALTLAAERNVKSPILSGGGVMTITDVRRRFEMGASAVAFGSLFLRRPWMPNRIIRQWRGQ